MLLLLLLLQLHCQHPRNPWKPIEMLPAAVRSLCVGVCVCRERVHLDLLSWVNKRERDNERERDSVKLLPSNWVGDFDFTLALSLPFSLYLSLSFNVSPCLALFLFWFFYASAKFESQLQSQSQLSFTHSYTATTHTHTHIHSRNWVCNLISAVGAYAAYTCSVAWQRLRICNENFANEKVATMK